MSSPPKFFGEDSKWLPPYNWGEDLHRGYVQMYGIRVVTAVPTLTTPGLLLACENQCNPSSSWCQPSPGLLPL